MSRGVTRTSAVPKKRSNIRSLAVVFCGLALWLTGCPTHEPRGVASTAGIHPTVGYRFPLPDGTSVDHQDFAGRPTVILFLTTYDTVSQAIARRLDEARHRCRPRINVLGVALEPPLNAPLVAVYRETVAIGYPIALADQDTLEGSGPFGDVRAVPTLVLLDAHSRVVRRGSGVTALTDVLAGLSELGVDTR